MIFAVLWQGLSEVSAESKEKIIEQTRHLNMSCDDFKWKDVEELVR